MGGRGVAGTPSPTLRSSDTPTGTPSDSISGTPAEISTHSSGTPGESPVVFSNDREEGVDPGKTRGVLGPSQEVHTSISTRFHNST